MNTPFGRRDFLYGLGASLGSVALTDMLAKHTTAESKEATPSAKLPDKSAKACILLYMAGGPSHIDTFDPKPALDKLHMQKFVRKDKFASAMASGERYFVRSPFQFRQVGESGLSMCEHFEHLPNVADDLCVYHGCQAESINHPTANYHMNTGNRFGGDPAIGSWVNYGLGSENEDLPGFIVLPEVGLSTGRRCELVEWFLAATFSRHSTSCQRLTDPGPQSA